MATPTSLPAAFVAGAVLTAQQQNDLRGAFRVLQVLSTGAISTNTTNGTNAFVDATGLSLSITPSSTTSKILILLQSNFYNTGGNAGNGMDVILVRGATQIANPHTRLGFSNTALIQTGGMSIFHLDSPATTSATTYKIQFRNVVGAQNVQINNNGASSNLMLFEISA
jgi:hypothetical protein